MKSHIEVLSEIISARRSVYPAMYIDKPIEKSTLEAILKSANYAPTHRQTQPWRFVVITKGTLPAFATEMSELYKKNTSPDKFSEKKYADIHDKILRAGAIIAICLRPHPELLPEWEEIASTATAVQNMWLTATAHGLGSYWSSPGMIHHLKPFLRLPEEQKCIGLFYMGYTEAVLPQSPRTPIEEKTTWI